MNMTRGGGHRLAMKPRRGLMGHESAITSLAISADERLAFSTSLDLMCRLWDLSTFTELARLGPFEDDTGSGHFCMGGNFVVFTVSGLGCRRRGWQTLKVWDIKASRYARMVDTERLTVTSLVVAAKGTIAYAHMTGRNMKSLGVAALDLEKGVIARWVIKDEEIFDPLAVSPDGGLLAVTLPGGGMAAYRTENGERIYHETVTGIPPMVGCMAFSPDGARLAMIDHRQARVWDTKTWNRTGRFAGGRSGAFSHDGSLLAVGGEAPRIMPEDITGEAKTVIWDVAQGRAAGTIALDSTVGAVAFLKDGSLFTTSEGGEIILWRPV